MQDLVRVRELLQEYQYSKAELINLLHDVGHNLQSLSHLTLRQLAQLATKEGIQ